MPIAVHITTKSLKKYMTVVDPKQIKTLINKILLGDTNRAWNTAVVRKMKNKIQNVVSKELLESYRDF